MLSADDTALAAAITSARRRPALRLMVDWANDGAYAHPESDYTDLVESYDVERSLVTDLPAECSMVDGYVTSKMTAVLRSRRRDPITGRPAALSTAQTLSPLRTDSPLYRNPLHNRPARLDLGFRTTTGARLLPQFSGPISDIDPRTDGTVEVSVLDPSDQLRDEVTLPVWSQVIGRARRLGAVYDINTQWVIDYVLRRYPKMSASPPPRSNAIMAVSGHGGVVNELGVTFPPDGDLRTNGANFAQGGGGVGDLYEPGMWGLLCSGGYGVNVISWTRCAGLRLPTPFGEPGTAIGMSAWVWCGSGANAASASTIVKQFCLYGRTDCYRRDVPYPQGFYLSMRGDGNLVVGARGSMSANNGWATDVDLSASTAAWRFVGLVFHVRSNGTLVVTIRFNGQTIQRTMSSAFTVVDLPTPQVYADLHVAAQWSDFQVWDANNTSPSTANVAWPGEVWTPKSTIGVGLNYLTALPDVVGEEGWKVITDAVGAEYGLVGVDEAGWLSFQPRSTIPSAAAAVPVKELISEVNLVDYGLKTSVDSVRNVVTYTRKVQAWNWDLETIYEAKELDTWSFPPGETFIDVPLDSQVLMPEWAILTGGKVTDWQSPVQGYRAVFYGTANEAPNVLVSAIQSTIRVLTVRVYNQNNSWISLGAKPQADQPVVPAFKVAGWKILDLPEDVGSRRDEASIAKYNPRTLPLGGDKWRSSRAECLDRLADSLLAELAKPVPTLKDIEIVGDPRLQLGDVVRIRDTRGLIPNLLARLVKIKRTGSRDQAVRDVVAVRPFASTWPV